MDVLVVTGVHVLGRYTTEPGGPGGIRTHVLSSREITDFIRPILVKLVNAQMYEPLQGCLMNSQGNLKNSTRA